MEDASLRLEPGEKISIHIGNILVWVHHKQEKDDHIAEVSFTRDNRGPDDLVVNHRSHDGNIHLVVKGKIFEVEESLTLKK